MAIYGEEKAESFFRLVDPRHIGLIPRQLGDLYDFKFKGFHEWQPEHLAVLNGQPTAGKVTVEAEAVPDNRVVFVLDEEANYLPKSIAHEFTLNGRVELHKIEIKYGAAGDSLLPTSTSYSQYMDGALVASEKCEVQTISYGEAFAPDLFSLSSMGIPTGTTVSWGYDNDPPGDPGRLRFDGREIVASREYDASKPRIAFADASAASRGAVWRLLFIVINCIIIAGLAVFIYHRRQSAK